MTRALITGANRGIGLALTRALLERGVLVLAGAILGLIPADSVCFLNHPGRRGDY